MNEKKTTIDFKEKDGTILFFHPDCTQMRGSEKYIYEIICRANKKYGVLLFVETLSSYWKRKFAARGVRTVLLFKPPFLYWFFLPVSICINYFRTLPYVSNNSVVFATNFPLNFLAVLLSKKTMFFCFEPLSVFYDKERVHTFPPLSRLIIRLARFLYSSFDRFAALRSTVLATLNTDVALYIQKIYYRKPDVFFPNGVDTNLFRPLPRRSLLDYRILHSTDYTILKGTEILIRAFSLVARSLPDAHLYISESLRNNTKKKEFQWLAKSLTIDDRVHFVGTIPEKKLPRWYQSGDVFCFVGDVSCGGSTASLSVIEALSCQTPVIRSRGGAGEIQQNKTGLYVYSYTPQGIAKVIVSFFKLSKISREEMGKEGRKYCLKYFTWDVTEERLFQTVHRLIKE